MKHLIFYDDTCSLCQNFKRKITHLDKKEIFGFYPLHSPKATKELAEAPYLKDQDTMVLIEHFEHPTKRKIWVRGKGAMRIFWLLGGWSRSLGLLCFLPFGLDPLYRLIARHRRRFYS